LSSLGLSQILKISQNSTLLIRKKGESVDLHCQYDDSTYFAMFWYQHKPQEGLKLMVYSSSERQGDMEDGFKSWTLSREETTKATLTLSQPKDSDSAVYFCAAS
ncbi:hypothetical protein GDO81_024621, partial [Engystomops pustulosus]